MTTVTEIMAKVMAKATTPISKLATKALHQQ